MTNTSSSSSKHVPIRYTIELLRAGEAAYQPSFGEAEAIFQEASAQDIHVYQSIDAHPFAAGSQNLATYIYGDQHQGNFCLFIDNRYPDGYELLDKAAVRQIYLSSEEVVADGEA